MFFKLLVQVLVLKFCQTAKFNVIADIKFVSILEYLIILLSMWFVSMLDQRHPSVSFLFVPLPQHCHHQCN
ncbi:hypothetical protein KSS87_000381 [Heliosperma pusillum]|nr:hypothetical protein KSS87_000381 [Heliosperma pusillum]